jgi:hypothetical protein
MLLTHIHRDRSIGYLWFLERLNRSRVSGVTTRHGINYAYYDFYPYNPVYVRSLDPDNDNPVTVDYQIHLQLFLVTFHRLPNCSVDKFKETKCHVRVSKQSCKQGNRLIL